MITRGDDTPSGWLFSSVDPEALISGHDPLRKIRQVVKAALTVLDVALAAL